MTKDEALAAAERVLSLVNSQPRTPTREQVAEAIGYHHQPTNWPAVMVCIEAHQGLSRLKLPSEMIQSEEF